MTQVQIQQFVDDLFDGLSRNKQWKKYSNIREVKEFTKLLMNMPSFQRSLVKENKLH